jgi:2-Cys peroxiredoxin 5
VPRRALFHSTAPAFVQKGDAIPDLDVLVENSPGNKVNLAKELKGKGIILGVPAAFSRFACPSFEALRLISIQYDVGSMSG